MSGTIIEIEAFPRLHLGLVGMNNAGYRLNGGIGFSITKPQLCLTIRNSKSFLFNDNRTENKSEELFGKLEFLVNNVKKKYNLKTNIEVRLDGLLNSHNGFGSGTIIRLALLEALFKINNKQYDNNLLIAESGRGGTSGIGIRTYFDGGYVVDIGKKNLGQKLLPSNLQESSPNTSLLLDKGYMPSWPIGICIPNDIKTVTPGEELSFFSSNTNVGNQSVQQTLYHIIYGALAGLKENDIGSFTQSIRCLQQTEWKAAERSIYSGKIERIEKFLYDAGATAVGMSSLGPGLFFLGDIASIIKNCDNAVLSSCSLIVAETNNYGRRLNVKDN